MGSRVGNEPPALFRQLQAGKTAAAAGSAQVRAGGCDQRPGAVCLLKGSGMGRAMGIAGAESLSRLEAG